MIRKLPFSIILNNRFIPAVHIGFRRHATSSLSSLYTLQYSATIPLMDFIATFNALDVSQEKLLDDALINNSPAKQVDTLVSILTSASEIDEHML